MSDLDYLVLYQIVEIIEIQRKWQQEHYQENPELSLEEVVSEAFPVVVNQDLDGLVFEDVNLGEFRNVVNQRPLPLSDCLQLLFEVEKVLRVSIFDHGLSFCCNGWPFCLFLALLASCEDSKWLLVENIQDVEPVEVH